MISTIIVSIILLAIVSAIVIHLVRKKKRGKGSCGWMRQLRNVKILS